MSGLRAELSGKTAPEVPARSPLNFAAQTFPKTDTRRASLQQLKPGSFVRWPNLSLGGT